MQNQNAPCAVTAEAALTDWRCPGRSTTGGLTADPPGLAMHSVGAKSGFVPEKHLRALYLRSTGNGRIGFQLPLLDGLRVTLIGTLQRLLRSQSQPRQQLAHCAYPKVHSKFLLDQLSHHAASPQPKVQAVLARIASIDPAKPPPLLCRRQATRTPRRFGRTQGADSRTRTKRRVNPFVNRRPIEPVGFDHLRGPLTLAHPFNRHQPNRLQRLVIQCPSISLHAN